MNAEIRARLARRLSLLSIGVGLLIAFILLIAYQYVAERRHLQDEMQSQAAIIAANAAAALVFNDAKAANEIIGAIRLSPKIIGGALYREDGALLASEGKGAELLPPHLKAAAALPPSDSHSAWSGREIRSSVLTEDVRQDGIRVGTLMLYVSFDSLYRRLLEYGLSVLAIAAVAVGLSYRFTAGLRRMMAKTELRLEQLAYYDQCTGLHNRRFFELELKNAVARARRDPKGAALLFIDVDDFKKVNDSFGHEVGDQVLVMIAQRLKSVVRTTDMVARLGGDEFAAILYSIGDPENAAKVAREMISAIIEPFPTEPTPSHVGLSVGIVMMPIDGDDTVMLLRRADMAMYCAKTQGKNDFQFFSEEIDCKVRYDLQIEAGLRQALRDNGKGMWIAYQPQLCARTHRLIGVEALVRWRREDGNPCSPGDFIPVAEKTGLIAELGNWVMTQICRDLAQLRAAGLEVPKVAVNVSSRQLSRGSTTVEYFCQILDEFGESSSRFALELTESTLMEVGGAQLLDAFRDEGFSLAIDDFGTGYSSFGYLKRFQVSTLKIDQQFVRGLPEDSENAAIVTAVVQMARALSISVVAEGVETEAQAAFLAACGCDVFQGYLLGRPMPAAELLIYAQRMGDPPAAVSAAA